MDREFCHPSLFEPKSHTLIAWNEAEGMTIDHTTAHINTVERGLLESLPGYLLTETQNINVIKDDTLEVEIYMKQKTRDLLFELTVKEGDPDRISNITGTLSGIAGSFDLSSQRICGEAMNTSFPFARTNDKITAHTRLFETILTNRSDFHRWKLANHRKRSHRSVEKLQRRYADSHVHNRRLADSDRSRYDGNDRRLGKR